MGPQRRVSPPPCQTCLSVGNKGRASGVRPPPRRSPGRIYQRGQLRSSCHFYVFRKSGEAARSLLHSPGRIHPSPPATTYVWPEREKMWLIPNARTGNRLHCSCFAPPPAAFPPGAPCAYKYEKKSGFPSWPVSLLPLCLRFVVGESPSSALHFCRNARDFPAIVIYDLALLPAPHVPTIRFSVFRFTGSAILRSPSWASRPARVPEPPGGEVSFRPLEAIRRRRSQEKRERKKKERKRGARMGGEGNDK